MATVSISPLPPSHSAMSGRRVPLGNNPNGANSPFRPLGSNATKQKRSYATIQREESYGHAPPAKKQMLSSQQVLRTPPKQASHYQPEAKVVTRKVNATQPTTYEQSSRTAVRERSAQQTVSRAAKTSEQNLESVLAWQKHYRQVFPNYVFYFEGVTEEVRHKFAKQVTSLGARVEKFFSNLVTHVVTTRTIPPEVKSDLKGSSAPSSVTNDVQSENSQPRTINPSLLDRSSESTYGQSDSFGAKGKFTFEAPLNRRLPHHGEVEQKGQQSRTSDVLHKARSLGMKIWALEKLQRIMNNLLEPSSSLIPHGHDTRSNNIMGTANALRGADLSQLLRDERINGPSDRDPTVATKEISHFKGPFIYIHDIDERQKPIMVREYAKVANKEHGDWPQFRSVANGKCPFVDDDFGRRDEREKDAARAQKQQTAAPRTRANAAGESNRMEPPKALASRRTLTEMVDGSNRNVTVSSKQSNPFDSRSQQSRRTEPEASSKGNAFVSRAGAARLFAGEPVASGIQPSNITSAIRSTMSSTAAQPGAKAGTSKEIHGLQRKVLEKNSGGPGSYPSSHRTNEHTAPTAATRRKQANLGLIEEDTNPSESEEQARMENTRKAKAVQQRKSEKRDAKPGYCENCQDKFEDFDEHILSRKHRKFAERNENWKDLDDLLNTLTRPRRATMDDENCMCA